MLLSQIIPEFLMSKEIEEGNSVNTINAYRYDLNMFLSEINDIQLEIVRVFHIRKFLQILHQKNYKKRSLARKIACLKSFFTFCEENDYVHQNPTRNIKSPKIKIEESLPKYLTKEEINHLQDQLQNPELGTKIWRDKMNLLVRLMYATMARVSEISNLNIQDVDVEHEIIKVTGKGNKQRYIPLDTITAKFLKSHIENRKIEICSDNSPLFVNSWGNRLKPRSIQQEIMKLKIKLNLPLEKKLTPHIFRHTGATHLRQNGMDISELQDLLGHSSPNTTKIYAKNDISHLQKSYQKYHPLSLKE